MMTPDGEHMPGSGLIQLLHELSLNDLMAEFNADERR